MSNTDKPQRQHSRKKYFIDPKVQGTLLQQAVLSWVWTSITFALVISFCRVGPARLSGSDDPSGQFWYHLGPYMLASAVLFPIILFRSVRFSHRFAGPMVRVRRTLQELARGESPPPMQFRKNDYWLDLANDINEVSVVVSQLRSASASCSSQRDCVGVAGDAATPAEQSQAGIGTHV